MSRRTVTLSAIALACAALVAAIILWPRDAGAPRSSGSAATPTSSGSAQPVAVFIGDSYTVGTGTSLRGSGFTAILGAARGWEAINLAVAGTGYATSPDYAAVIPVAVSHEPEIVVVSGGRNDLAGGTIADIEPAVVEFYSQLRDALPDARIIVTSPLWDEAPTPPELVELRHIVEREAERVGAEYVDLGDMFEGRTDLIAADGLHPNEEGLQLIAERIDDLLADS